MGDDGLGPLFGSLPPDVLKQVILPELDLLERGLFALASGACWRAMKDSGLSCRVEKGVVCCLAASGGHLECLRYVREQHSCPWGADTCVEAAAQGHLECLQYSARTTAALGMLTRALKLRTTGTRVSPVRARARLPLGCCHLRLGCVARAPGVSPVRARAQLPLGRRHVRSSCGQRAAGACGTRVTTAAPGMLPLALVLRGKGAWSVRSSTLPEYCRLRSCSWWARAPGVSPGIL